MVAGLLRVSRVDWSILLLCIFGVLTAELFNSALESVARAIDTRHNPHLAAALDIASAAVLPAPWRRAGGGAHPRPALVGISPLDFLRGLTPPGVAQHVIHSTDA